jgi:hypothetical protein
MNGQGWKGCCKGATRNVACSDVVPVLAADGQTRARMPDGDLYEYDEDAHVLRAQDWCGKPLVLNHGAKEVGSIIRAWADGRGDLYMGVRVCNKYASQLNEVSIGTVPLKIGNGLIYDYKPVHLAMLTDGSEPGSDRAGRVVLGGV